MDLKGAQEKSKEIEEMLKKSGATIWNPEKRFIDLVEEVGELANAILFREGHKKSKSKQFDLTDSIMDVLFDLLCLANHYGIDVSEEYQKVLDDMKRRIGEGEF